MDFKALWSKFRKTFYFRVFILVLVSLLAVLLLQSPILCFSLVLIPVTMLLIPHWFGERSVKNHAINGLIIFVLATLLYASLLTPALLSLPQQAQGETNDPLGNPARATLSNGTVTPFQGAADTSFNFTVTLKSSDVNASQFVVRTKVLNVDGITVTGQMVDMTAMPGGTLATGKVFYGNSTLPPQVHLFNFEVFPNVTAGSNAVLVGTPGSYGPFNVGFGPHFLFELYRGLIQMAFLVFGFFLILLIYWWTRKAREIRGVQRERTEKGKRAEGGGEFTCTNCGADVAETDTKCPSCGAVFESEEDSKPAKAEA